VTALVLVLMLGLGSLFLSVSVAYAQLVYSLLFGEVLGISPNDVIPTAALAVACIAAIALVYRPLMLSSVLSEVGEARGVSSLRIELCFLAVLALATTMTVPVVGTLLIFSLMIGPPAAARSFTDRPGPALALSVAIALLTVWAANAASYLTNYPVGFFVGSISAGSFAIGRAWAAARGARRARSGVRFDPRPDGAQI
jgi:zinc/manganese transport system permease protein